MIIESPQSVQMASIQVAKPFTVDDIVNDVACLHVSNNIILSHSSNMEGESKQGI
jgi:hypothetical protein